MAIERIIVLDDDPIIRKNLEQFLCRKGLEVKGTSTMEETEALLDHESFDLIFVDIELPDGKGTELLEKLREAPKKPLVVFITGHGTIDSAVECMKNGALDYLPKPFMPDRIEVVLERANQFNQLIKVNQFYSAQQKVDDEYEILGQSPQVGHLRNLIDKIAPTQATVLIQGESGTGKELVSRAIHGRSPRADKPFIKLNCAAVPENLIESEFFGHEKGSFTGALAKREGRFELAHKGTILLDEISEISPVVQAKLLRVLQEREFERVGGNRSIKVDVRVIATTNRNLAESVHQGDFREDLYFRLNVVPIPVPPLRERQGEIGMLAEHFLRRFARRHGSRARRLSPACVDALLAHTWPGNVRELQNVVERAVILCGDQEIVDVDYLGFDPKRMLSAQASSAAASALSEPIGSAGSAGSVEGATDEEVLPLSEMEKRHIFAALDETEGNRTHAAKLLGISIRTLRNKLNEYNGKAGAAS